MQRTTNPILLPAFYAVVMLTKNLQIRDYTRPKLIKVGSNPCRKKIIFLFEFRVNVVKSKVAAMMVRVFQDATNTILNPLTASCAR